MLVLPLCVDVREDDVYEHNLLLLASMQLKPVLVLNKVTGPACQAGLTCVYYWTPDACCLSRPEPFGLYPLCSSVAVVSALLQRLWGSELWPFPKASLLLATVSKM